MLHVFGDLREFITGAGAKHKPDVEGFIARLHYRVNCCCCWLLLVVVGCCCWCCWLLLLMLLVVVGCCWCCGLLLVVVVDVVVVVHHEGRAEHKPGDLPLEHLLILFYNLSTLSIDRDFPGKITVTKLKINLNNIYITYGHIFIHKKFQLFVITYKINAIKDQNNLQSLVVRCRGFHRQVVDCCWCCSAQPAGRPMQITNQV